MLCPNCGSYNPDDVKFCSVCGTFINAADSSGAYPYIAPGYTQPQSDPRISPDPALYTSPVLEPDSAAVKKPFKPLSVILPIAVIALAAALIALFVAYSGVKDKLDSQNIEISQLTTEINDKNKQVSQMKLTAGTYNEIISFLNSSQGALYNHYENFNISSPVFFVKKGETISITPYSSYYGTFWADTKDLKNCLGEWASGTMTFKVTGQTVGTGIIHFETNSYEDNFYVMVVCYD